MKTIRIFAFLFLASAGNLLAATSLDPTISPALFKTNTQITVVYDVTGTPLAALTDAYAWVWIPSNLTIDAKYNVTPATSAQAPAKFTKLVSNGKTTFTLVFTPSDFFAASISSATQMGILLKATDWPGGQTSDFLANFWDGSFQAKLTSPLDNPLFVTNGQSITVSAQSSVPATFTLKINNKLFNTQTNISNYTLNITASDTVRSTQVDLTASAAGSTSTVSFNYVISHPSDPAPRPAGIIDGINYPADPTKVTLSLWAPQKTSVYVIGDFNNWKADPAYEMKKDGEHFWLDISGLTSGTEYAFQYLVDESIFVGDPYCDKILDKSNDQYIPTATYPNLKAYPAGAIHNESYFNYVSVLQTGQTAYTWTTNSFVKPAKEKLVIYELLIRDFFDSNNRNYQNLIDTIGYFKSLGVNAIELMPITEFSGNDSWGYNPNYMFAPDKYYGTKNKLKEFVDIAHKNGIAVIMDMVLNQQDLPNPYLEMYFDFNSFKPLASNPWFNVTATHPYSVFFDMNHESTYTKKYLDTINYYWSSQYKIDGFRYDLAKGFTQTNNPTDVSAWGKYDPSRIAIFKRMADVFWTNYPDNYIILEYFAENQEETELANYRAAEGKGMMLWENFNYAFNQISMGYATGSDVSASYYVNKQWSKPREVAYMESHDEERLMYNNLTHGNSSGGYSVTNPNTALYRMKGTSLIFYTIPGAKMLWEFGEMGYDKSINTCADGTVGDCRVVAKPVLWNYYSLTPREKLRIFTKDLIRLRRDYSVFTEGDASIQGNGVLQKQVILKNKPYTETPADSTQMNAVSMANMDVTTQSVSVSFPHTGTWYDYFNSGTEFNVTATPQSISLPPGDFRLYTDVKITRPLINLITGIEESKMLTAELYPNPTDGTLHLDSETAATSLILRNMYGSVIAPTQTAENTWDVRDLMAGFYVAQVRLNGKTYQIKVIKK